LSVEVKLGILFIVDETDWQLLWPGAFVLCSEELMKLTPIINFTNISQTAFRQYPFTKKLQTQTLHTEKLQKYFRIKSFL